MKFFFALFALALTLSVHAAELKLATISSDTTTEVTVFYVETNDDGSAQAMRYVTTAESGQIIEDVHGRIDEILNGGVVLRMMEGREVIRLFLENFDRTTGGRVRLRYLANGVTGGKDDFYMKLVKKEGNFILSEDNGRPLNSLYIWGNWSRLLRRWIGVRLIEPSFQKKNT